MRIICISLLVCLSCLVSAKYVLDENVSSFVSRKQRSDESNVSTENTEDDTSDIVHFLERKGAEKQLKLQEKRNKTERKRLDKERELQNKFVDKERKQQENLKKAKGKRQKILEKEERKHQEKLQNQSEKIDKKIIKQSILISDNSAIYAVQNDSMDPGNILKRYSKYALSTNSSEVEKAAVLNRYLQEELGLHVNSTESEYCQAVLQIIQNKLSNDSATANSLHNHITELETKIAELDGKARFMQNVNLPWVTKVQKVLQQKKNFLESVVRYLRNVLPNWITAGQAASNNANGTNVNLSSSNATKLIISGANISVADTTGPVLAIQSGSDLVSGAANVVPVNLSTSSNATSPDTSTMTDNSSNATPVNTSVSTAVISNGTLPIASFFSNPTANETNVSGASNNVTGTGTEESIVVTTEAVPTSTDISASVSNLLVTTAPTLTSSVATVINTVATPSEGTLNSSIAIAADVSAVITSGIYEVTATNSVVSTTESKVVTENFKNIVSTNAPEVAHTNVPQRVAE